MRICVLLLTLLLAVGATPALATMLNVELTASYFPPASFPADSMFVGTASFYIDIRGGNGPQLTDSPATIFLDIFSRTVVALEDPSLVDPCVADGSCGVDVSVRGKAGPFVAIGFPNLVDLPSEPPVQAPIVPIGSLSPADPCRDASGGPCHQSGRIVAYDPGPVVVGTWEVALSDVPEPDTIVPVGAALLLVLGGYGRLRRRTMVFPR